MSEQVKLQEPKAKAKASYTEKQPTPPEPAPAVAPLEFPKGADGKVQEGLPKAPRANPDGPIPRTIHQNERAPEGLKRFKILGTNSSPARPRYVLAKSKDEACEHYVKSLGKLGEGFELQLAVKELPD